MKKSIGIVVLMCAAVWALPEAGSAITLTAGRIAKFKNPAGTASDKAIVKFISDPAIVAPFPDPRCPQPSSLIITTDMQTLGPIALTCGLWKQTSSGYIYKDADATTGVQKILFHTRSKKILIKLKGDVYGANAIAGGVSVTFAEARLDLDTTSYCGRFQVPPSTEKKNTAEALMYKGPSAACFEPPPTATDTPTNTPIPTDTFTAGPSPTPTSTGTSTNTRTPSNTPTATASFTNTALGAPTATQGPPRAFRVDSVALQDPHAYPNALGCSDVTGIANALIAGQFTADSEPDGFYDLSLLAVFPNLNQPPAPGGNIDVRSADCTAVPGAEVCSPDANPPNSTTYVNQAGGTCVAPIAGTTGPDNVGTYTPAITDATAPCAGSIPTTITFALGLFTIPLEDVQIGATYVGNPATTLINGLIRGFVSEATANTVIVPLPLAFGGNTPLSALLAGGLGNCSTLDDRDPGPGAQSGWYVYLNFTAHAVTWNP